MQGYYRKINKIMKLNIKGIILGLLGALIITPDTLFMKLSKFGPYEMLSWRGLETAIILFFVWYFISKNRKFDFLNSMKSNGIIASLLIGIGGISFTYAISVSLVSIVLFALAFSPFVSAFFSYYILREKISKFSLFFLFTALVGISIAVLDIKSLDLNINNNNIKGCFLGLFTAFTLGISLVLFRSDKSLPVMLINSYGGFIAGISGLIYLLFNNNVINLLNGKIFFISISGFIIIPLSFFLLTYSTRFTSATNISLFLLLETILGPIWIWFFIGEKLSKNQIFGGILVILSIISFILKSKNYETK
jgi:drug/metabolite transporter (DMT)-like permease